MILILALTLLPVARADVLDRIEVVVGDRIVCASDVALEAALDPHDQGPVSALEDLATPYRERLVDLAVLRGLAGEIEVFRPAPADVEARWQRFRASFDTPEAAARFLTDWGFTEAEFKGLLFSRMVSERYVLRNLPGGVAGGAPFREWMDGLRARVAIRDAAASLGADPSGPPAAP